MEGIRATGLAALQAYGSPTGAAGGIKSPLESGAGSVGASGIDTIGSQNSFADLVSGAIKSVEAQGVETQAQTQAIVAGEGNLVDVVTAIAETEVALETMVSVRDKVISAYEEIMRMPI
ncbi:MAG: flagellar hook-basal body complex protein FliE [Pseudomonadota bacterium]